MREESKARQGKGKILLFNPTGEAYFAKGLKAYQKRDYYKAKKYMMRAMQLEPGEPMIVCQYAVICSDMGDYQEANGWLYTILEELDEDMVECHYFLANNYAHLGLFKDAYHHANLYLELDEEGEFAEDALDLLEVLSIEVDEFTGDPYEQDDLIIKQEQARKLLESGHFPKAVEILQSVISDYPEYWSAYNNLALAYFYLGEAEKATTILDKVFTENPGNLHAICNKLVFAFYERKENEVELLKDQLKKVCPLSFEHQFKLGATFALIGEYEEAYLWLHRLERRGFYGDGAFYYWYAYAAHFTGREELAISIWERVVELNPEKVGFEPWNAEKNHPQGLEHHASTIRQKLTSDTLEERLFALFLLSVSSHRQELVTSKEVKHNPKQTHLEREYVVFIRDDKGASVGKGEIPLHEVALKLYQFHQPIGTAEMGLFLMWFSTFIELTRREMDIRNTSAYAGAIEYQWCKLKGKKLAQVELAKKYGVSPSTLGKYVKLVNELLS